MQVRGHVSMGGSISSKFLITSLIAGFNQSKMTSSRWLSKSTNDCWWLFRRSALIFWKLSGPPTNLLHMGDERKAGLEANKSTHSHYHTLTQVHTHTGTHSHESWRVPIATWIYLEMLKGDTQGGNTTPWALFHAFIYTVACMCTHTHMHTHTCTDTCTHTQTRAHTHTRTCTHTHTWTHRHIYVCIMHVCAWPDTWAYSQGQLVSQCGHLLVLHHDKLCTEVMVLDAGDNGLCNDIWPAVKKDKEKMEFNNDRI